MNALREIQELLPAKPKLPLVNQIKEIVDRALSAESTASEETRAATQEHAILNTLIEHCGRMLTQALVEKLTKELLHEIRDGACSWSFKP